MAPEILENNGYDYLVDYWSLGCILFEFLSGIYQFINIYIYIYIYFFFYPYFLIFLQKYFNNK